MTHRAAPSFWQEYNALDADIRKLADKSFEILKKDPQHPSLHLKKAGRFWSARVGLPVVSEGIQSDNSTLRGQVRSVIPK